MVDEVWRPIPGFPRYEASSLGRIRSVQYYETVNNRWGGTTTRVNKGKILSPYFHQRYFTISLGSGYSDTVHRIVCLAFHGPSPGEGYEVNHKNTDTRDNTADNLEWVTPAQNKQHTIRMGNHNRAKLSIEQVKEARGRMLAGESAFSIHKEYDVSYHAMKCIKNGKSYGWVT